MYFTIGNIACQNRRLQDGHELLGIIPAMSTHLELIHSAHPRRRKLEIFQECLSLVLEPLKQASKV